jgi:hypothetical protein
MPITLCTGPGRPNPARPGNGDQHRRQYERERSSDRRAAARRRAEDREGQRQEPPCIPG